MNRKKAARAVRVTALIVGAAIDILCVVMLVVSASQGHVAWTVAFGTFVICTTIRTATDKRPQRNVTVQLQTTATDAAEIARSLHRILEEQS